jgi:hypothetical protein
MNNYFTFPCDIFLVKEKRVVEAHSLDDIPNDVTFRILKPRQSSDVQLTFDERYLFIKEEDHVS